MGQNLILIINQYQSFPFSIKSKILEEVEKQIGERVMEKSLPHKKKQLVKKRIQRKLSELCKVPVSCKAHTHTHIPTHSFTIFTQYLHTYLQGSYKRGKPHNIYIQNVQSVIYRLHVPYIIQLEFPYLINLHLDFIDTQIAYTTIPDLPGFVIIQ